MGRRITSEPQHSGIRKMDASKIPQGCNIYIYIYINPLHDSVSHKFSWTNGPFMRRNNEAFTTHLAPDDAESQEVTIKQNTKRASTGRCHACNKFNRNHPRTCCKGTTSDFTSLAMAQQSLVRMCSFFEFCKKSLRD